MSISAGPAKRPGTVAVCAMLAVLLAVGLSVYRHYGISWDEPVQREYGEKVYRYVTGADEGLLNDRHRVYGPVVEFLLYSLETGLGLQEQRDIYLMRHLVNFLIFALGVLFFYLLAARAMGSRGLALVGAVILVMSPRIFAHAFYNSKDIPFMAMFTVCIYTLLLHLDMRKLHISVLHGICCAVLVDIRIMGALVPLLTSAFFLHDVYGRVAGKRAGGARRTILNFTAFTAALIPLTILLWPTLWNDPVGSFISAFHAMRGFAWRATVLFMGQEVWSDELPNHYAAVWILITTPLMYIALAAAGLMASVLRLARGKVVTAPSRRDVLVVLIWLFLPLIYVAASNAVLYDTWRHLFFIYPAVVLLSLLGLRWLRDSLRAIIPGRGHAVATAVVFALLALNMAGAASFMIRHHPHQNVYFNSLVGGVGGADGRYEMDYWGLSYRQLLESLLAQDTRDTIRVYSLNRPGYYNSLLLEGGDRDRIVYVEQPKDADYYITNFRWDRLRPPPEAEAVNVNVDGVKLSAAYRFR